MASTSFDTIDPADSLEFCPTPGYQDLLACGTYKLLDNGEPSPDSLNSATVPQTRRGQCLLFKCAFETKSKDVIPSFRNVQAVDLPAIPDMRWCHRSTGLPLLAIADSEGNVTLNEWREESLSQVHAIRCATEDTLCLSLDWSNRRSGGSIGSLVVSLSNGKLCLLTPSEGGSLSLQEMWHAHDYEPWIAAWNYWDHNIIFSGGDDLKMKAWDIRQGFDQTTFVNNRFDAGVTTIQSHPFVEHLIAVGSYDNTVRLFDTRKPLVPITQADVGGGAWRVKWHPSETRKQDLLVACMHDGFKVVRFGSPDGSDFATTSDVIQRYDGHESLAYGADWSYAQPSANGISLIGCCSFYDHKMSLWSA